MSREISNHLSGLPPHLTPETSPAQSQPPASQPETVPTPAESQVAAGSEFHFVPQPPLSVLGAEKYFQQMQENSGSLSPEQKSEQLANEAERRGDAGNLEDAARLYARAAELKPKSADLWLKAARAHQAWADQSVIAPDVRKALHQESLRLSDLGLQANTDHSELLLLKAQLLAMAGKSDEAKKLLIDQIRSHQKQIDQALSETQNAPTLFAFIEETFSQNELLKTGLENFGASLPLEMAQKDLAQNLRSLQAQLDLKQAEKDRISQTLEGLGKELSLTGRAAEIISGVLVGRGSGSLTDEQQLLWQNQYQLEGRFSKLSEEMAALKSKSRTFEKQLNRQGLECRQEIQKSGTTKEKLARLNSLLQIDREVKDAKAFSEDLRLFTEILDGADGELKATERFDHYAQILKEWSLLRDQKELILGNQVSVWQSLPELQEMMIRMEEIQSRLLQLNPETFSDPTSSQVLWEMLEGLIHRGDPALRAHLSVEGFKNYFLHSQQAEALLQKAYETEDLKSRQLLRLSALHETASLHQNEKMEAVLSSLLEKLASEKNEKDQILLLTHILEALEGTGQEATLIALRSLAKSEIENILKVADVDPMIQSERLMAARQLAQTAHEEGLVRQMESALTEVRDQLAQKLSEAQNGTYSIDLEKRLEIAQRLVETNGSLDPNEEITKECARLKSAKRQANRFGDAVERRMEAHSAQTAELNTQALQQAKANVMARRMEHLALWKKEILSAESLPVERRLELGKRLLQSTLAYKAFTTTRAALLDSSVFETELKSVTSLLKSLIRQGVESRLKAELATEEKEILVQDAFTVFESALQKIDSARPETLQFLEEISLSALQLFVQKDELARAHLHELQAEYRKFDLKTARPGELETYLEKFEKLAEHFSELRLFELVKEAMDAHLKLGKLEEIAPPEKAHLLLKVAEVYRKAGMLSECRSLLYQVHQMPGDGLESVQDLAHAMALLLDGSVEKAKDVLRRLSQDEMAVSLLHALEASEKHQKVALSLQIARSVMASYARQEKKLGSKIAGDQLEVQQELILAQMDRLVSSGETKTLAEAFHQVKMQPEFQAVLGSFSESNAGSRLQTFLEEISRPHVRETDLARATTRLAVSLATFGDYDISGEVMGFFAGSKDEQVAKIIKGFEAQLSEATLSKDALGIFLAINPMVMAFTSASTIKSLGDFRNSVGDQAVDFALGAVTKIAVAGKIASLITKKFGQKALGSLAGRAAIFTAEEAANLFGMGLRNHFLSLMDPEALPSEEGAFAKELKKNILQSLMGRLAGASMGRVGKAAARTKTFGQAGKMGQRELGKWSGRVMKGLTYQANITSMVVSDIMAEELGWAPKAQKSLLGHFIHSMKMDREIHAVGRHIHFVANVATRGKWTSLEHSVAQQIEQAKAERQAEHLHESARHQLEAEGRELTPEKIHERALQLYAYAQRQEALGKNLDDHELHQAFKNVHQQVHQLAENLKLSNPEDARAIEDHLRTMVLQGHLTQAQLSHLLENPPNLSSIESGVSAFVRVRNEDFQGGYRNAGRVEVDETPEALKARENQEVQVRQQMLAQIALWAIDHTDSTHSTAGVITHLSSRMDALSAAVTEASRHLIGKAPHAAEELAQWQNLDLSLRQQLFTRLLASPMASKEAAFDPQNLSRLIENLPQALRLLNEGLKDFVKRVTAQENDHPDSHEALSPQVRLISALALNALSDTSLKSPEKLSVRVEALRESSEKIEKALAEATEKILGKSSEPKDVITLKQRLIYECVDLKDRSDALVIKAIARIQKIAKKNAGANQNPNPAGASASGGPNTPDHIQTSVSVGSPKSERATHPSLLQGEILHQRLHTIAFNVRAVLNSDLPALMSKSPAEIAQQVRGFVADHLEADPVLAEHPALQKMVDSLTTSVLLVQEHEARLRSPERTPEERKISLKNRLSEAGLDPKLIEASAEVEKILAPLSEPSQNLKQAFAQVSEALLQISEDHPTLAALALPALSDSANTSASSLPEDKSSPLAQTHAVPAPAPVTNLEPKPAPIISKPTLEFAKKVFDPANNPELITQVPELPHTPEAPDAPQTLAAGLVAGAEGRAAAKKAAGRKSDPKDKVVDGDKEFVGLKPEKLAPAFAAGGDGGGGYSERELSLIFGAGEESRPPIPTQFAHYLDAEKARQEMMEDHRELFDTDISKVREKIAQLKREYKVELRLAQQTKGPLARLLESKYELDLLALKLHEARLDALSLTEYLPIEEYQRRAREAVQEGNLELAMRCRAAIDALQDREGIKGRSGIEHLVEDIFPFYSHREIDDTPFELNIAGALGFTDSSEGGTFLPEGVVRASLGLRGENESVETFEKRLKEETASWTALSQHLAPAHPVVSLLLSVTGFERRLLVEDTVINLPNEIGNAINLARAKTGAFTPFENPVVLNRNTESNLELLNHDWKVLDNLGNEIYDLAASREFVERIREHKLALLASQERHLLSAKSTKDIDSIREKLKEEIACLRTQDLSPDLLKDPLAIEDLVLTIARASTLKALIYQLDPANAGSSKIYTFIDATLEIMAEQGLIQSKKSDLSALIPTPLIIDPASAGSVPSASVVLSALKIMLAHAAADPITRDTILSGALGLQVALSGAAARLRAGALELYAQATDFVHARLAHIEQTFASAAAALSGLQPALAGGVGEIGRVENLFSSGGEAPNRSEEYQQVLDQVLLLNDKSPAKERISKLSGLAEAHFAKGNKLESWYLGLVIKEIQITALGNGSPTLENLQNQLSNVRFTRDQLARQTKQAFNTVLIRQLEKLEEQELVLSLAIERRLWSEQSEMSVWNTSLSKAQKQWKDYFEKNSHPRTARNMLFARARVEAITAALLVSKGYSESDFVSVLENTPCSFVGYDRVLNDSHLENGGLSLMSSLKPNWDYEGAHGPIHLFNLASHTEDFNYNKKNIRITVILADNQLDLFIENIPKTAGERAHNFVNHYTHELILLIQSPNNHDIGEREGPIKAFYEEQLANRALEQTQHEKIELRFIIDPAGNPVCIQGYGVAPDTEILSTQLFSYAIDSSFKEISPPQGLTKKPRAKAPIPAEVIPIDRLRNVGGLVSGDPSNDYSPLPAYVPFPTLLEIAVTGHPTLAGAALSAVGMAAGYLATHANARRAVVRVCEQMVEGVVSIYKSATDFTHAKLLALKHTIDIFADSLQPAHALALAGADGPPLGDTGILMMNGRGSGDTKRLSKDQTIQKLLGPFKMKHGPQYKKNWAISCFQNIAEIGRIAQDKSSPHNKLAKRFLKSIDLANPSQSENPLGAYLMAPRRPNLENLARNSKFVEALRAAAKALEEHENTSLLKMLYLRAQRINAVYGQEGGVLPIIHDTEKGLGVGAPGSLRFNFLKNLFQDVHVGPTSFPAKARCTRELALLKKKLGISENGSLKPPVDLTPVAAYVPFPTFIELAVTGHPTLAGAALSAVGMAAGYLATHANARRAVVRVCEQMVEGVVSIYKSATDFTHAKLLALKHTIDIFADSFQPAHALALAGGVGAPTEDAGILMMEGNGNVGGVSGQNQKVRVFDLALGKHENLLSGFVGTAEELTRKTAAEVSKYIEGKKKTKKATQPSDVVVLAVIRRSLADIGLSLKGEENTIFETQKEMAAEEARMAGEVNYVPKAGDEKFIQESLASYDSTPLGSGALSEAADSAFKSALLEIAPDRSNFPEIKRRLLRIIRTDYFLKFRAEGGVVCLRRLDDFLSILERNGSVDPWWANYLKENPANVRQVMFKLERKHQENEDGYNFLVNNTYILEAAMSLPDESLANEGGQLLWLLPDRLIDRLSISPKGHPTVTAQITFDRSTPEEIVELRKQDQWPEVISRTTVEGVHGNDSHPFEVWAHDARLHRPLLNTYSPEFRKNLYLIAQAFHETLGKLPENLKPLVEAFDAQKYLEHIVEGGCFRKPDLLTKTTEEGPYGNSSYQDAFLKLFQFLDHLFPLHFVAQDNATAAAYFFKDLTEAIPTDSPHREETLNAFKDACPSDWVEVEAAVLKLTSPHLSLWKKYFGRDEQKPLHDALTAAAAKLDSGSLDIPENRSQFIAGFVGELIRKVYDSASPGREYPNTIFYNLNSIFEILTMVVSEGTTESSVFHQFETHLDTSLYPPPESSVDSSASFINPDRIINLIREHLSVNEETLTKINRLFSLRTGPISATSPTSEPGHEIAFREGFGFKIIPVSGSRGFTLLEPLLGIVGISSVAAGIKALGSHSFSMSDLIASAAGSVSLHDSVKLVAGVALTGVVAMAFWEKGIFGGLREVAADAARKVFSAAIKAAEAIHAASTGDTKRVVTLEELLAQQPANETEVFCTWDNTPYFVVTSAKRHTNFPDTLVNGKTKGWSREDQKYLEMEITLVTKKPEGIENYFKSEALDEVDAFLPRFALMFIDRDLRDPVFTSFYTAAKNVGLLTQKGTTHLKLVVDRDTETILEISCEELPQNQNKFTARGFRKNDRGFALFEPMAVTATAVGIFALLKHSPDFASALAHRVSEGIQPISEALAQAFLLAHDLASQAAHVAYTMGQAALEVIATSIAAAAKGNVFFTMGNVQEATGATIDLDWDSTTAPAVPVRNERLSKTNSRRIDSQSYCDFWSCMSVETVSSDIPPQRIRLEAVLTDHSRMQLGLRSTSPNRDPKFRRQALQLWGHLRSAVLNRHSPAHPFFEAVQIEVERLNSEGKSFDTVEMVYDVSHQKPPFVRFTNGTVLVAQVDFSEVQTERRVYIDQPHVVAEVHPNAARIEEGVEETPPESGVIRRPGTLGAIIPFGLFEGSDAHALGLRTMFGEDTVVEKVRVWVFKHGAQLGESALRHPYLAGAIVGLVSSILFWYVLRRDLEVDADTEQPKPANKTPQPGLKNTGPVGINNEIVEGNVEQVLKDFYLHPEHWNNRPISEIFWRFQDKVLGTRAVLTKTVEVPVLVLDILGSEIPSKKIALTALVVGEASRGPLFSYETAFGSEPTVDKLHQYLDCTTANSKPPWNLYQAYAENEGLFKSAAPLEVTLILDSNGKVFSIHLPEKNQTFKIKGFEEAGSDDLPPRPSGSSPRSSGIFPAGFFAEEYELPVKETQDPKNPERGFITLAPLVSLAALTGAFLLARANPQLAADVIHTTKDFTLGAIQDLVSAYDSATQAATTLYHSAAEMLAALAALAKGKMIVGIGITTGAASDESIKVDGLTYTPKHTETDEIFWNGRKIILEAVWMGYANTPISFNDEARALLGVGKLKLFVQAFLNAPTPPKAADFKMSGNVADFVAKYLKGSLLLYAAALNEDFTIRAYLLPGDAQTGGVHSINLLGRLRVTQPTFEGEDITLDNVPPPSTQPARPLLPVTQPPCVKTTDITLNLGLGDFVKVRIAWEGEQLPDTKKQKILKQIEQLILHNNIPTDLRGDAVDHILHCKGADRIYKNPKGISVSCEIAVDDKDCTLTRFQIFDRNQEIVRLPLPNLPNPSLELQTVTNNFLLGDGRYGVLSVVWENIPRFIREGDLVNFLVSCRTQLDKALLVIPSTPDSVPRLIAQQLGPNQTAELCACLDFDPDTAQMRIIGYKVYRLDVFYPWDDKSVLIRKLLFDSRNPSFTQTSRVAFQLNESTYSHTAAVQSNLGQWTVNLVLVESPAETSSPLSDPAAEIAGYISAARRLIKHGNGPLEDNEPKLVFLNSTDANVAQFIHPQFNLTLPPFSIDGNRTVLSYNTEDAGFATWLPSDPQGESYNEVTFYIGRDGVVHAIQTTQNLGSEGKKTTTTTHYLRPGAELVYETQPIVSLK